MSTSSEHFDLIVIGSGPAGEKGAAQVAYFGKRVALIEKEPVLGGAAANTGTLPSKTLRESALFLSGYRNRDLHGLTITMKKQVTVRDFMARERLVRETERERIRQNLARHHVQLYRGTASFVPTHAEGTPWEVAVRPERAPEIRITGDVVLIATGSYPHRPPEFPFHDTRVYDSDTILTLHDIPRSMLVVGGGVIGCEYACMFAALGIEVSLVEQRDRLMGFLDAEISSALQRQMENAGVRLMMPDAVASLTTGELLAVQFKSGASLSVETVLVSAGRNGNTAALGLDKIGIVADKRGKIQVDANYQTTAPRVYAAGDAIGNPALASTSMEQARIAMVQAFDLKYRKGLPTLLPYGVYTIPECSMVGETEESLTKAGVAYVVGKANYDQNARGQIVGDSNGFLKLIFQQDDMKLLGVHMIGEQATELVHVGLTAMMAGAGADLFINTCYNYPTLTELYKYATYDALGRRAQRLKAAAAT